MKKVFKITLIIVLVIIFILLVTMGLMARGLNDIKAMAISDIDINSMEDGTYTGNFDGGRWTNQLEVEIKGQKITDIRIVKDIRFPMEGIAEKIFHQVLKEQSISVDVISGATVTSKAYLKSIEDALLSK
ncbi:FMN-binding protein [Alkaliphilus serpentinus]|uniref:FMN-binding protein n=1 Tax=Alkaliphilus serpentinus TaxID=1482731 RepID=A0A833HQ99_9FIRM|nr:FMN-binding protein [Alkaliphilus serpentinus]KAB3531541.1 FMN-binding protein [Alkaliphilus serpentinus]